MLKGAAYTCDVTKPKLDTRDVIKSKLLLLDFASRKAKTCTANANWRKNSEKNKSFEITFYIEKNKL